MCHVLHYSCNVNTAVADSLRCRMICGTTQLTQLCYDAFAA